LSPPLIIPSDGAACRLVRQDDVQLYLGPIAGGFERRGRRSR
jgi:hypothetical protein